MSWMAGDTHFLVSDNQNHLASGAHAHGGATRLNQPRDTEIQQTQAQIEDDTLLMGFVKDYLNKHI
jgi:hypothetical protein